MKKTVTTVCLAMLACGVTAYAKPTQSLATKLETSVNHMVNAAARLDTIPTETMQNITSAAMQNYQMQGQAPTIIVQDAQNPNQSITIKNMQNANKNSEIIVKNQTNTPNSTQTTIYPNTKTNTTTRVGYPIRTQPSTTQTYTGSMQRNMGYTNQNNSGYTMQNNGYTNQTRYTQPRYITPNTNTYVNNLQNNAARTTEKQNNMVERKGIIMVYSSKIKNNDITLTEQDKQMIREYVGIIEETTNFFNRNKGSFSKQVESVQNMNNANLANAKLLRANQNLQNRYQNFATGIDAMDGIIQVVENRANQTANNQNSTNTMQTQMPTAQAQTTPQMEKTNPNATLVYKAPTVLVPNGNEQIIVKNMPYRTTNNLSTNM